MKMKLPMMVLALVGAVLVTSAPAAPEPNIVPDSWELTFKHETPAVISVRLPGEDKPQLYYYMTYTVSNRTGEDQLFIPDVWMLTDSGELMQANRNVPPAVFRAIKRDQENPLLEDPMTIVGKLLQGEDNAKDGVVMWQVPQEDVDHIRIFFGGLSGETHEVTDPATGKPRLLRKTLMLAYDTPGDAQHAASKPFVLKERKWIVR